MSRWMTVAVDDHCTHRQTGIHHNCHSLRRSSIATVQRLPTAASTATVPHSDSHPLRRSFTAIAHRGGSKSRNFAPAAQVTVAVTIATRTPNRWLPLGWKITVRIAAPSLRAFPPFVYRYLPPLFCYYPSSQVACNVDCQPCDPWYRIFSSALVL